jgi:phage-related holin
VTPAAQQSWSLPALLKWLCAVIASLWIAIPGGVQTLMLLMVCDFAARWIAEKRAGRPLCLDSAVRGLWQKCGTLLLIVATSIAVRSIHVGWDAGNAIGLAFVATEFCSIVRNVKRSGVAIPQSVVDFMGQVQKLTNGNGSEEEPPKARAKQAGE